MVDEAHEALARARHLASECRYLARELAGREKQKLQEAQRSWFAWFGRKDPAQRAFDRLQQEMDRKRAALRIAIDQLVGEYCDDLRASPWYAGAASNRDAALAEERSLVAPQRRLIGRMREIRRSVCDSGDNPLRQWNPLMPREHSIALDWGRVCYDLSRLVDEAIQAGLPDLRPHLQRGVYLPPEEPNAWRLSKWFNRNGETMRWTMGQGIGAITLTIPGVLSALDQWLRDAESLLAGQGATEAEENRQELDDRILAAAHAKLPDDLKQWLFA